MRRTILCLIALVLISAPVLAQAPSGVPVFQITPVQSTIKFDVEASVAIEGTFDKWDASLRFTSPEAESAVSSNLEGD